MPYYIMNFLDYYLQRQTTSVNAPETSALTEISFTDAGQTEMDKTEHFEGENKSQYQAVEGGQGKNEQPLGCNSGGEKQTNIMQTLKQ